MSTSSDWCNSPHPNDPSLTCKASARNATAHDLHFSMNEETGLPVHWENLDYVPPPPPPSRQRTSQVRQDMLGRARMVDEANRPVVRITDPETAHLAAQRIEPHRETRKGKVLARLRLGGWVDGVELATEAIGGSEGLRRLRELSDDGWAIERRPHPGSDTTWQYRLQGLDPTSITSDGGDG